MTAFGQTLKVTLMIVLVFFIFLFVDYYGLNSFFEKRGKYNNMF